MYDIENCIDLVQCLNNWMSSWMASAFTKINIVIDIRKLREDRFPAHLPLILMFVHSTIHIKGKKYSKFFLCLSLLVKSIFFFILNSLKQYKTGIFFFIKAVLLLCKRVLFFLNFASPAWSIFPLSPSPKHYQGYLQTKKKAWFLIIMLLACMYFLQCKTDLYKSFADKKSA